MPDDRSNATMGTHSGTAPGAAEAPGAREAPGAARVTRAAGGPSHPEQAPAGRRWPRVVRELGLLAIIYEEISAHLVQAGSVAASNALLIVGAERSLGLFDERAAQAVFLHNDTITDAFNASYGGTHFLVPAFVLGWLMFRHPGQYGRARTALAMLTLAAFACFWLFPVAPPRLLPAHFEIVDMLRAPDGSGDLESSLITTAGDRYASMPSVHVAWAVWCALALWPVVRPRILRALVVAYPLMTILVVVVTGNHYFLDTIAGAGLAVVTWIAVTRIGAWLSVRRGMRASVQTALRSSVGTSASRCSATFRDSGSR
ncbi:MAG TPA: phosphatase PAP2 family protein [Streptosporangiaceae bacterium]|jgi:membrane-associated phospholipid phosphatase